MVASWWLFLVHIELGGAVRDNEQSNGGVNQRSNKRKGPKWIAMDFAQGLYGFHFIGYIV